LLKNIFIENYFAKKYFRNSILLTRERRSAAGRKNIFIENNFDKNIILEIVFC